jgi:dienelactone hydrolase
MSWFHAPAVQTGWLLRTVIVVLSTVMHTLAHSEPRSTLADGAHGKIEFHSYTPASQAPLLARSYLQQQPVVIGGELALPERSPLARGGRMPAVILMHGSGGISEEREHAWAKRLNAIGVATFIVDSFTGRGIRPPMYAGQSQFISFVAHLLDAYLALEILATHPQIDATRVALMGFSRGGETSVNAVFEPFRTGALGVPQVKFAAYIPLYPYCNFRHSSKTLLAAPMLMLLGGADEETEPLPCQHLAEELKERGVPVRVIVYPGAHHGFDRLRGVSFDKSYVGIRKCEAVYDLDSRVIRRLDTGALLDTRQKNEEWVRECRKTGARFGGDPKAREAAIAEVRRFLLDVFRP